MATLGGHLDIQSADCTTYKPITRLPILWAMGGTTGAFTSVMSNVSFLSPSLQYLPSEVDLTLRRTDIQFSRSGARGSALGVAQVLSTLVATADGAMADVINNVIRLGR